MRGCRPYSRPRHAFRDRRREAIKERMRMGWRRWAALMVCAAAAACSGEPPPASVAPPRTAETEALQAPGARASSPTLRKVRARGRLNCGVNGTLAGFSAKDDRGLWRGFDVDLCRAVAAAVLGDARLVTYTALDERARFAALQSGAVDLLARNTAWTFSRDTALGVDFVGISFYDSQGFLALRSLNLQSAEDMAGRRICVEAGAQQSTMADFFRARSLSYTPVPAETAAAARQAFERNDCDVLAGDISTLAGARAVLARPGAYSLLPDRAAEAPLGPVVREGDDGWAAVVRWTLNSLILAEEMGITAQSAPQARRESNDPQVRRLLGVEGAYGRLLGLPIDWAYRAINQVGSYGEIFDRHLGPDTPLGLERGRSALWNAPEPGLLYAPPMR